MDVSKAVGNWRHNDQQYLEISVERALTPASSSEPSFLFKQLKTSNFLRLLGIDYTNTRWPLSRLWSKGEEHFSTKFVVSDDGVAILSALLLQVIFISSPPIALPPYYPPPPLQKAMNQASSSLLSQLSAINTCNKTEGTITTSRLLLITLHHSHRHSSPLSLK